MSSATSWSWRSARSFCWANFAKSRRVQPAQHLEPHSFEDGASDLAGEAQNCTDEAEESYDSSTAAGTRDGTVTRLPLPAVWVFLPRRVILRHDKHNMECRSGF